MPPSGTRLRNQLKFPRLYVQVASKIRRFGASFLSQGILSGARSAGYTVGPEFVIHGEREKPLQHAEQVPNRLRRVSRSYARHAPGQRYYRGRDSSKAWSEHLDARESKNRELIWGGIRQLRMLPATHPTDNRLAQRRGQRGSVAYRQEWSGFSTFVSLGSWLGELYGTERRE